MKKLTTQQLRQYLQKAQAARDNNEYKRLKAVFLFIIKHKQAKEITQIVDSPPRTIYKWIHLYKKYGIEGLLSKPKGGRRREYMTKQREKEIVSEMKNEANKGHISNIKKIKQPIEKELKHDVSRSYLYNLAKRNGWRKVAPRKYNPKSSKEEQEQFKKDFHELVAQKAKEFKKIRPILVLFEDEARFGRINEPRRCWAPQGMRPKVAFQMVRQFDYVFATVDPKTGHTFPLILPEANSAMMNIFLGRLARHYHEFNVIIVADQAPWHKSDMVKPRENIRFLYLCTASPELNPAEPYWKYIRENPLANLTFDSLDELEAALERALHDVYVNPESIRSLVSFSWIN